MEDHAGEAYAAGPAIVEGLLVLEQATVSGPDRMQHCIGRGNTANTIAVTHLGGGLEPAPRVAGRRAVEHLVVKQLDLFLQSWIDRVGIAEFGPHVAQIDTPDVRDRPAGRRFGRLAAPG